MTKNFVPDSTEKTADLFTPSLQEHTDQTSWEKPWRLQSQMWVAFFGGVLAVTGIAFWNGRRLKVTTQKENQILLVGAAGFILTLAAAYLTIALDLASTWQPGETGFRLISRAIALLTWVVLNRLQRSADRIYQYFHNGEYDPLWVPGLAAILTLGIVQSLILYFLFIFPPTLMRP